MKTLSELLKPKDEHGKKIMNVFTKTFVISEIILMLIVLFIFIGVGTFNFVLFLIMGLIMTIISLFFAVIGAALCGAGIKGRQIGEIIEAKHKEIKKKKD